MKDILWLVRKILVNTFRKKSNWFTLIVLPIVGVLISMMIYGNGSADTLRVGVVNLDGDNEITRGTVSFVEGLKQVKMTVMDEGEMKKEIAAGKLDTGIVFEQGFAEQVRSGSPQGIRIVSVKGAQVTAYVKSLLQNYIGNVASIGAFAKADQAKFDNMYNDYRQQHFKLDAVAMKDTTAVKGMTYQSLGFLAAFMMFSAVNLTELILKEKENRTFLRLMTSPVSSRVYVLSNVLVNIVLIFLQIVITLFVMKNIFHIDSGVPSGELAAVMLLFGLTAIALSLLIVAFAKNTSMAGALQNLIITPTCLLAGCYFPIDIMPDNVRKISTFLPQHWLLETVDKLQAGSTLGSLYMNLLILLAFAAVFALIAIYRFSRNNDTRTFV
ncbi:ABC transporter permease [Paenibacillus caui]|uniref:ABC transporter permease n=1 Tax=Paenibacillus caui TaxID=2873927 RepID=UPI001CA832D7|nr:ABC transporter permease [Paenibacillus caui]